MSAIIFHTRTVHRLFVLWTVAVIVLIWSTHQAYADQMSDLTRTLLSSKHHKERIGAAVSLGRLKDPRSLKALIKGLEDEHQNVRALAAVALGRIGDERALPALEKATKDPEELVRRRANEAITEIRQQKSYKISQGKGDPGFGRNPRPVERPEVYVLLQSAADKSADESADKPADRSGSKPADKSGGKPGDKPADKSGGKPAGPARKQANQELAEQMRSLLVEELQATPGITIDARLAKKLRITQYNLDASIMRFSRRTSGRNVEIECEIRLTISDERGKMLSFLTGSAKVQVPKRAFKDKYLPRLQLEALENAVKGVHQDLLAHLRKSKTP